MRTKEIPATARAPAATCPEANEPPAVFSDELRGLVKGLEGRPVQLGTLFEATQGRGDNLLLLLITLPFVTPIPLPGVSAPFGIVVALIGARLALGQKPWLPKRLLAWQLPASALEKFLPLASRVVKVLEYFLRPRLSFVRNHAVFARIAGLLTAISGLFLILPVPLPFSNSLPAWTVIFLAAGALGRDGLFFIAGCGSFVVSIAYFLFLTLGGIAAIEKLRLLLLTHTPNLKPPFNTGEFLEAFARYNQAVPLAPILLSLGAFGIVWAIIRHARNAGRIAGFGLAFLWLWSGLAYHVAVFSQVTSIAIWFGVAFVLQAVAFAYAAAHDKLAPRVSRGWRTVAGAIVIGYALVGYSLLCLGFGAAWPAMPTFGVPCPVVIFTWGLILWCDPSLPKYLLAVPIAWSVIGTSAVIYFNVYADLGLIVAATLGTASFILSRSKRVRPSTASPAAQF